YSTLSPEDVDHAADAIKSAAIILMQLETPLETVIHAARLAASGVGQVILNPAPAQALPDELFKNIDILTPNEPEAAMLSGITLPDHDSARAAGHAIRAKGVGTVIITLGAKC